jgi:hypothetical protein
MMVVTCGGEARVNTSSCCGGGYRGVELVFWGFGLDRWGKQGRVTQVRTSVVHGWLRLVDTAANPVAWLCLSWAGFGLWTENIIMSCSIRVWTYVIVCLHGENSVSFLIHSLLRKRKKKGLWDQYVVSVCLPSIQLLNEISYFLICYTW